MYLQKLNILSPFKGQAQKKYNFKKACHVTVFSHLKLAFKMFFFPFWLKWQLPEWETSEKFQAFYEKSSYLDLRPL